VRLLKPRAATPRRRACARPSSRRRARRALDFVAAAAVSTCARSRATIAWAALTRSHAAAASYSWMSPASSSRRRITFVDPAGSHRAEGILPGAGACRSSAVRPLLVVVADIDAEDVLELPATEDQEPVEALPPHAPDPALDVRIRVRRLQRRPDTSPGVRRRSLVGGCASRFAQAMRKPAACRPDAGPRPFRPSCAGPARRSQPGRKGRSPTHTALRFRSLRRSARRLLPAVVRGRRWRRDRAVGEGRRLWSARLAREPCEQDRVRVGGRVAAVRVVDRLFGGRPNRDLARRTLPEQSGGDSAGRGGDQ
jgi:hypothetical protein